LIAIQGKSPQEAFDVIPEEPRVNAKFAFFVEDT